MHDHLDATLEKLIDGELPANEYKALLSSLDDEPGGWRRCATAFLESQALATDLIHIRRSPDLSRHPIEETSPSEPIGPIRPSSPIRPTVLLAIAASFLIAFYLGIAAPKFFSMVRQELASNGNLNTAGNLAAGPSQSGVPHHTLRPVGNLNVVMDGPAGEITEAQNVPVYEVGQDVEAYLSQDVPVLRPELLELLRLQGYDVQRHQQYVPASLDDGRQIIVPLDGYQITPVSRRY